MWTHVQPPCDQRSNYLFSKPAGWSLPTPPKVQLIISTINCYCIYTQAQLTLISLMQEWKIWSGKAYVIPQGSWATLLLLYCLVEVWLLRYRNKYRQSSSTSILTGINWIRATVISKKMIGYPTGEKKCFYRE